MRFIISVFGIAMVFFLAACEEEKYPVSGEDCGPADPVQELEAADCTIPGTGNVGM